MTTHLAVDVPTVRPARSRTGCAFIEVIRVVREFVSRPWKYRGLGARACGLKEAEDLETAGESVRKGVDKAAAHAATAEPQEAGAEVSLG